MDLPRAGETLAERFQLHEKLGEGGFSWVFRATELEQPAVELAVKLIKSDSARGHSPELVARFEREVAVLSRLSSPHSVRLRGHGRTSSGLLYMAFEYVPGSDLSAVLAERGRLEPVEVVTLLRQLLAALGEAHSLGLVHRDIKPQNVRVLNHADGIVVRLLDFGIAKPIADGTSITETGTLVGTPRYMSPEQLRGRHVGPSSDIYSLGMLAFEMLGGQHALPGARLGDQIERMRSGFVFSVPDMQRIGPKLLTVLNRMTARDAASRFASAESVLNALDRLDGAPHASPRPTEPRRPMGRMVALVTVLVLTLFLVGLWLLNTEDPPVSAQKIPERAAALMNEQPARVSPPQTDMLLEFDAGTARSFGCGRHVSFTGVGMLRSDDVLERDEWVVRIPHGYDPHHPGPMVVLFHEDGADGRDIIERTGFGGIADAHQIILVAPNGRNTLVDHLPMVSGAAWREPVSIERAHVRIEQTMDQLCVDTRHIYLVGHGSGGFAAMELSCEPWAAGIALSAFRRREEGFKCHPARPIPTLKMGVTRSGNSPPEGGEGCGSTSKLALADDDHDWRARNNCRAPRTETYNSDGHRCHRWTCDQPTEICHLDGGMNWPGSDAVDNVGEPGCQEPLIDDFPGTRHVWAFFTTLGGNAED